MIIMIQNGYCRGLTLIEKLSKLKWFKLFELKIESGRKRVVQKMEKSEKSSSVIDIEFSFIHSFV